MRYSAGWSRTNFCGPMGERYKPVVSRMNARGDIVPVPGLLASLVLSTANTAAWSYTPFDEAPAFRLIANALNTSNTTPVMRAAERLHTDAGPVALTFPRTEALRGFHGREAIFELRRLTGLTWGDLAELMSVSRRSLHLWSNGQPINTPNERRLRDLVSAMRALDRGTARENRAVLMSPRAEGGVFSDLLREGRFDEAYTRAGRGQGRPAPVGEARNARPQGDQLSVEDVFSTRSDRVHTNDGVALPRRRRLRQA